MATKTAPQAQLVESAPGIFKVICPKCDEVIFEAGSRSAVLWNAPRITDHVCNHLASIVQLVPSQ